MAKKTARYYHDKIVSLIGAGLTNPEIAKDIGISKSAIAAYVKKNLEGNPNYQKKKSKHNHLHEKILKLRLKISDEEIREKLGLTKSEMKSCMTYAYKKPEFAHLRKDTRRKDPWTSEELKLLLKYSGLISRKELSALIKRGNSEIVIKEKLQLLGICSKNVNGLTLSKFRALFKKDPIYFLETSAGSPSSKFLNYPTHFKIVPWMHINEMIKNEHINAPQVFKIYIETMAMFQEWIHGKDYWKSLCSMPSVNFS